MTFSSSNFFPWALKLIFFISRRVKECFLPWLSHEHTVASETNHVNGAAFRAFAVAASGEENVFRWFPSVLRYNLVQKHAYCGLHSDRLFWGCLKKWVIGGFVLPLPAKVRSSPCHVTESTKQGLSAHTWWGWALCYFHVEPENSGWCVRMRVFTYVCGSEWVNALSVLGCLQSLCGSAAFSGFEMQE